MDIVWQTQDQAAWDAAHGAAAAALQQDWAYGEAMAGLGAQTLRCWAVDGGAPVALAQFIVRRFGGFVQVALCTRGPVWLREMDRAAREEVVRRIRGSAPLGWPRLLLFSPEATDGSSSGLARRHRVMTGYATVLLDLGQSVQALRAGLQRNWRNRLVSAEASPLRIERVGNKPAQYQWLLERDRAQRKTRGYKGLPLDFIPAYQAARGAGSAMLTLRADLGRNAVGGMLFLRHGTAATYYVGWSDEATRLPGAHNLLLWNAILALKEAGVKTLDLGGINTERSAGIARFKMGCGGEVSVLAGTYL